MFGFITDILDYTERKCGRAAPFVIGLGTGVVAVGGVTIFSVVAGPVGFWTSTSFVCGSAFFGVSASSIHSNANQKFKREEKDNRKKLEKGIAKKENENEILKKIYADQRSVFEQENKNSQMLLEKAQKACTSQQKQKENLNKENIELKVEMTELKQKNAILREEVASLRKENTSLRKRLNVSNNNNVTTYRTTGLFACNTSNNNYESAADTSSNDEEFDEVESLKMD